jgi:hypothetical protein
VKARTKLKELLASKYDVLSFSNTEVTHDGQ